MTGKTPPPIRTIQRNLVQKMYVVSCLERNLITIECYKATRFLLINIIGWISSNSTKNNKNIVHIQWLHYFIRLIFIWWHCSSNSSNVSIIPCIVVHYDRSVTHCSYLVSIVPPGHHLSIWRSILTKPKICLSVVIKDDPTTIGSSGSQYDGRRRICLRCNPGAVYGIPTKQIKGPKKQSRSNVFLERQRLIKCSLQKISTNTKCYPELWDQDKKTA